jgi:hypothetical protein
MLASRKSASSALSSREAVLGGGGKKRGLDSGSSWAQGNAKASTSSSSSSLFKPRVQASKTASGSSKPGIGSSKGKERDEGDAAPTYKRYGYTDRATMRRAGILDTGEADQTSEDRRPRGMRILETESFQANAQPLTAQVWIYPSSKLRREHCCKEMTMCRKRSHCHKRLKKRSSEN